MSLHRFFIHPDQCQGKDLVLQDREAHHALHVVRVRQGQTVEILNGQGTRLLCEVTALHRNQVGLHVTERRQDDPLLHPITLFQAVAKPKAMDAIIQKAAELGVTRIIPLLTERVVSKPSDTGTKSEKWTWIAIDALKQCGSSWLPVIESPRSLAASLESDALPDLTLVASLQSRTHPRIVFERHQAGTTGRPRSAGAWIGPEGDFTDEELRAIESAGAHAITLGPLVLRSDTAAIALLTILHHELSDPGV
jgi:16S rRNA (uracil1498-N3)-methyltransferase